MNYEKLTEDIKEKSSYLQLSLKMQAESERLSEVPNPSSSLSIGLGTFTASGLTKAMKERRLTVSHFELICRVLNLSPNDYLEVPATAKDIQRAEAQSDLEADLEECRRLVKSQNAIIEGFIAKK